MERTIVYLRSVCAVLDEYFHLHLVNVRHIKMSLDRRLINKTVNEIINRCLLDYQKGSLIPPQHIHENLELYRHHRKIALQRGKRRIWSNHNVNDSRPR